MHHRHVLSDPKHHKPSSGGTRIIMCFICCARLASQHKADAQVVAHKSAAFMQSLLWRCSRFTDMPQPISRLTSLTHLSLPRDGLQLPAAQAARYQPEKPE